VDLARQFLVQKRGCGNRRRFQISREEGEALWDAWGGSLEGIEEREGGRRACSVGKVLYAIERRATRASSGVDDPALADVEAKIGAEFCEFDKLPRVRFECSMLQTAVEGADGVVTWRDVQCGVREGSKWQGGDPDDFEALWSQEWCVGDFVEDDEVCLVPTSQPDDWTQPLKMSESWNSGGRDNRVLRGKLIRVRGGRESDGVVDASMSSTLGRMSGVMTRAMTKSACDGEGVGRAAAAAGTGRGQGRTGACNRFGLVDELVVQPPARRPRRRTPTSSSHAS
jgi:hypothetical protein